MVVAGLIIPPCFPRSLSWVLWTCFTFLYLCQRLKEAGNDIQPTGLECRKRETEGYERSGPNEQPPAELDCVREAGERWRHRSNETSSLLSPLQKS